jgi:hypothetical protein
VSAPAITLRRRSRSTHSGTGLDSACTSRETHRAREQGTSAVAPVDGPSSGWTGAGGGVASEQPRLGGEVRTPRGFAMNARNGACSWGSHAFGDVGRAGRRRLSRRLYDGRTRARAGGLDRRRRSPSGAGLIDRCSVHGC